MQQNQILSDNCAAEVGRSQSDNRPKAADLCGPCPVDPLIVDQSVRRVGKRTGWRSVANRISRGVPPKFRARGLIMGLRLRIFRNICKLHGRKVWCSQKGLGEGS